MIEFMLSGSPGEQGSNPNRYLGEVGSANPCRTESGLETSSSQACSSLFV